MSYAPSWNSCFRASAFCLALAACLAAVQASAAEAPPSVGDAAPDFELQSVAGQTVKLSKLLAEGPVVLVVLRGYPGYQCPICHAQVGELLNQASKFKDAGARVVLVYPGPSNGLEDRAAEFLRNKTIPDHFALVTDPDYKLTNAYHLRWDAPRETAYPSAMVIDPTGKIRYALVSKTHGGRARSADLLSALAKK